MTDDGEAPDESPAPEDSRELRGANGFDLLRGSNARQILERLLDGDPLELAARCREQQSARAMLIENRRLHLRAAAHVAHAAREYRGTPPLSVWLRERIDQAIEDLVREEREDERAGRIPTTASDPRVDFFAQIFCVERDLARKACIAFNHLPQDARSTAWDVLVLGKSLDRIALERCKSAELIRRHLEIALEAIQAATRVDRDELGNGRQK